METLASGKEVFLHVSVSMDAATLDGKSLRWGRYTFLPLVSEAYSKDNNLMSTLDFSFAGQRIMDHGMSWSFHYCSWLV